MEGNSNSQFTFELKDLSYDEIQDMSDDDLLDFCGYEIIEI